MGRICWPGRPIARSRRHSVRRVEFARSALEPRPARPCTALLGPLAASLGSPAGCAACSRDHGCPHVSLGSLAERPPCHCRRRSPPHAAAVPSKRRLLYWTAADGAAQREAYDALADAIACLGASPAAAARWTAQAAALRRAAERGADDLPSARAAGGEALSLHRVSLSDEPGQLFLLSK